MEYERVKYVLKSYLRTRLSKIERNLLFYIEKDKANLMCEEEIHFAADLYEQRKTYFNEAFGSKIKPQLNPFNDEDQLPDKYSKCMPSSICSHTAERGRVRFRANADCPLSLRNYASDRG